MNEQIPWFVEAVAFFPGPLLIALNVPLLRRKVPPNGTYGFRLPSTMADERVWYDMNALAGLHLILIAIAYCVLLAAMLAFEPQHSVEFRLFVPLGSLLVALILDVIVLGVAAGRHLRRLKRQDAAAPARR